MLMTQRFRQRFELFLQLEKLKTPADLSFCGGNFYRVGSAAFALAARQNLPSAQLGRLSGAAIKPC
ncbi:MAG TPA: hypothetical protein VIP08_06435 [Phenylobacterium sp.]|uniref:hypothetical protein n=1 Tax=Phenylobacterium sp. TaxID=1871053 RepID=UPI002F939E1F